MVDPELIPGTVGDRQGYTLDVHYRSPRTHAFTLRGILESPNYLLMFLGNGRKVDNSVDTRIPYKTPHRLYPKLKKAARHSSVQNSFTYVFKSF